MITPGAAYNATLPLVEIVPTAGFNVHVTPVLALPATVAANCWVCEALSEIVEGATETVTVAAAFTVRLNCFELLPAALVALTLNVAMPAAVGVPLSMPVADPRLSPAGSVPLVTAQVIGVVPPAIRVCEAAAPVTPSGNGDDVVMEGGVAAAVTVRLNCLELLPDALVALTVNVETPAAVGVPLMVPVEEPRLSPAGSVPPVTAHVIGVVPAATRLRE